ncbi:hypothetical protein Agabi119p4_7659 [Agaricus bisporus var. burnettii]|uniref:Uncharacterized protein n=1 Tax=Agaricus bisporus var. burnettii TaxID=192524 RepID=A0A8H7C7N1_AGABI|nr:hypothetical protein Agabi119p4_7659 [Agaricus bisporus var. burnettii]
MIILQKAPYTDAFQAIHPAKEDNLLKDSHDVLEEQWTVCTINDDGSIGCGRDSHARSSVGSRSRGGKCKQFGASIAWEKIEDCSLFVSTNPVLQIQRTFD